MSKYLKVETYNSASELIEDRIGLLVKNGAKEKQLEITGMPIHDSIYYKLTHEQANPAVQD